jgi:hypothetical protein
MPRKGQTRVEAAIETREREATVLQLKKAGVSNDRIARQLGVDPASVHTILRRALNRLTALPAEELRTMMAAQLDMVSEHMARIMTNPQPRLYRGRAVEPVEQRMPDGTVRMVTPVDYEFPIAAGALLVRTQESYRRLFGVDLPTRVELTGAGGGPIELSVEEREARASAVMEHIKQIRMAPVPELTQGEVAS